MGRFKDRTNQVPMDQILAPRRCNHGLSRIGPKHFKEQIPYSIALDCEGIRRTNAIALR